MEITISTQFLLWFGAGLLIWFIFGLILTRSHKNTSAEKFINILLVLVWIILHVYGFFNNIEVAVIFDLIWWGAVGHLVGFDVMQLVDKFQKWKK